MTDFEIKEKIGREAFLIHSANMNITDVKFTDWTYEQYDGTYYSANTLTFFEIKVRNCSGGAKFTGKPEGFILEKKKYDFLKDLQSKETKKSSYVYINIFSDCIVIWDITNLNIINWKEDNFRKDNVQMKQIPKKITYLKIKDRSNSRFKTIDFNFITQLIINLNNKQE